MAGTRVEGDHLLHAGYGLSELPVHHAHPQAHPITATLPPCTPLPQNPLHVIPTNLDGLALQLMSAINMNI